MPETVISTPSLDQEDPEFAAVRRVVRQYGVVEKVLAEQQPGHPGAGIDQHAQRHHDLDHALRRDPLGGVDTEDDGIQNDHAGRDHAGLEAAARPEFAVELDVEGEQKDERQEKLDADAQDEIELHVAPPSPGSSARRRLRPLSRSSTPMPAVKMTVVSPERVVAAVVGEHRGHHVGNHRLLDGVARGSGARRACGWRCRASRRAAGCRFPRQSPHRCRRRRTAAGRPCAAADTPSTWSGAAWRGEGRWIRRRRRRPRSWPHRRHRARSARSPSGSCRCRRARSTPNRLRVRTTPIVTAASRVSSTMLMKASMAASPRSRALPAAPSGPPRVAA